MMSTTGRVITWLATVLAITFVSAFVWTTGVGGGVAEYDPTGAVVEAAVLAVVSIGAVKARPGWAPEIARSVGWVVAAAAWFFAVVADFSSASATNATASMGFALFLLAAAYAVCLRPDADKVKQERTVNEIAEAVARRIEAK